MKKSLLFTSLLLVVLLALTVSGCGAALKEAAKLSEYDMSGDKIPSITSVVGEREVTGVESGTSNGCQNKQYTYESASVFDDLWAYISLLMEQGWLVTQDIDLAVVPGTGQLGKQSKDDGEILLLSISYEDTQYTIKIVKGEGTIK